jgi:N-acetylneuraminate synthase/N,N'-diacetyllegionaminate synthase
MIIATGMATLQEVKNAVKAIKSQKNNQIIALHCTTNYPSNMDEVNLNAMITMKKELDCLVGYSDHTLGTTVPVLATALGAAIIEKHFTIDKKLPGPDHKASLEPYELQNMIKEIRETEKILGSYDKKPTKSEEKIMDLVRKSLVAKTDIDKGAIIKRDMINIKRPGTGLKPWEIDKIVGKRTKKDIVKDEIFKLDMVK